MTAERADAGRRSGAASAIASGVLALLLGFWHLIGLAGGVLNVAGGHSGFLETIVGLGANLALACLLLAGGALLLRRRPPGRPTTLVGAALAIVMYLLLAALGSAELTGSRYGVAALLAVGVPAAAAAGLALIPATGRWLVRTEPPVPSARYRPSAPDRRRRR